MPDGIEEPTPLLYYVTFRYVGIDPLDENYISRKLTIVEHFQKVIFKDTEDLDLFVFI